MATLTVRERNLLRQHYLDGVSLEGLARLHGVSRATVAWWLSDARETVLGGTREHLRVRAPLTDSEVDSLIDLARTRLDAKISVILKRDDGD